jgi:S-phase kinase-associated protein 1
MKLISSDGHEFVVSQTVADQMLILTKNEWDSVPLPNVTAETLAHVVAWCLDRTPVPEAHLMDVCLAADYLDIEPLVDVTTRLIADTLKGKSPKEIRRRLDFETQEC